MKLQFLSKEEVVEYNEDGSYEREKKWFVCPLALRLPNIPQGVGE